MFYNINPPVNERYTLQPSIKWQGWKKVMCIFYMLQNICVDRKKERERERCISLSPSLPSPSQVRVLPLSKIVRLAWLEGESW